MYLFYGTYDTVQPVCNDHLYNKFFTRDLFSNVF